MTMTAWRIVKSRRAHESKIVNGFEIPAAFDGTGASLYPGRWNSKGIPVIYTAASQSLATLELLVHLEDSSLLESYSVFSVEFNKKMLKVLNNLPENWQENPPNQSTRKLGDAWFRGKESLVLGVPSAVIPNEVNYIINPYHFDINELVIGEPQVFPFDARLNRQDNG